MLLRLPSALATPPKSKPNVKEKKKSPTKRKKTKAGQNKGGGREAAAARAACYGASWITWVTIMSIHLY